jgi:hypothetical protein
MSVSKTRFIIAPALVLGAAALFTAQPAPAAESAKAAYGKAAAEFYKASTAFSSALSDLSKMSDKASPYDKDMLTRINGQFGTVDATADGVLALGYVASEMSAPADLAAAKKHLMKRCEALKRLSDASGQYVNGLIANIAAPAIIAAAKKVAAANTELGQQALCSGK